MLSLSVPPCFAPTKVLLAPEGLLVLLCAGEANPAATSRAAPIAVATIESHSRLCMPLLSVTADGHAGRVAQWTHLRVLALRRGERYLVSEITSKRLGLA